MIRYYSLSGTLPSKDQGNLGLPSDIVEGGRERKRERKNMGGGRERRRERIERRVDLIRSIAPAISEACILDIPVM